ncbi:MAG: hypothetical protein ACODAB_09170 [Gemmatimonadota bacterium]
MSEAKNIAIVGTAPPHWRDAPYDDPEWEVWSLSRNYERLPRWDRWFELHRARHLCKTWEPGNGEQEELLRRVYTEWLARQDKPVYVHPEEPAKADGIPFPVDEVLRDVPRRYFTNTVSWMIGYALLQEPETIGLWGVNMELASEYGEQRPSCEYLVGIAEGRGVEVVIPETASLLAARRLYAFDPPDSMLAKMAERADALRQQKAEVDRERRELDTKSAVLAGGIEIADLVLREGR